MITKNIHAEPFVKWVGGKRQLLPYILPLIPEYTVYYEPFLGGGAVFFSEMPKKAVINDLNEELINCYRVIKDVPYELLDYLNFHSLNNCSEYFYKIRNLDRQKEVYASLPTTEKAARTIYLNKTCYNGLYRVNSSGEFNAPFGKYKNPNIINKETILAVSEFLNAIDVEIYAGDYRNILGNVRPGAFVYLDPPYMPIKYDSFTGYTAEGFDVNEQIALKNECDYLNNIGAKFLLSNSYCDFIEKLYDKYIITRVPAKRNINSCGAGRGPIYELLIRNYN